MHALHKTICKDTKLLMHCNDNKFEIIVAFSLVVLIKKGLQTIAALQTLIVKLEL